MRSLLLISPLLLLLAACATQSVPTGGPKDVTPPKVLHSMPDSAAIHFQGKTIDVEFNEYINLNNPQEQIIISPPLDKKPDIHLKGKHVIIEIKDTLRKNTTYTINFGNSVSDLREGNILTNYRLAFSTGAYVDSLVFKGKVENAYSGVPEKDVLIMLYSQDDDSVPIKKKPLYFAKTTADGHFLITNIATGHYKLFALKDANSNYLFDQPSESIAFVDEALQMNADHGDTAMVLKLFTEDRVRQRTTKARLSGYGRFVMTFARPVSPFFQVKAYKSVRLQPADSLANLWEVKEKNKNNDSLTWWFTNDAMDSLHFTISDTNIKDTVHLALVERKEQKKRDGKVFYPLSNLDNHTIEAHQPYDLVFNTPVKKMNTRLLFLREDSVLVKNPEIKQDSACPRIFHIQYKFKEEADYKLLIQKDAFTNIFGDTNDTLRTNFRVRPADEYGNLSFTLDIINPKHQYLLQLTDEAGNTLQENIIKGSIHKQYDFLKPQKYKIRLIFDTNENGKWDTGNYLHHLQPEKVLYFKDVITIRAKWGQESTWRMGE